MAYVITRLCRDCIDTACVAVCPVACIYEYAGAERDRFPNQLYIHAQDCIDCGACEPECAWQAIFEEALVPEPFSDDLCLNREIVAELSAFRVAEYRKSRRPTPEEVEENQRKWSGVTCSECGEPGGAPAEPSERLRTAQRNP